MKTLTRPDVFYSFNSSHNIEEKVFSIETKENEIGTFFKDKTALRINCIYDKSKVEKEIKIPKKKKKRKKKTGKKKVKKKKKKKEVKVELFLPKNPRKEKKTIIEKPPTEIETIKDNEELQQKEEKPQPKKKKKGLLFDSNFESGNLEKVYQLTPTEFNLVIGENPITNPNYVRIFEEHERRIAQQEASQNGSKSKQKEKQKKKTTPTKHSQWYFFSVENMKKGETYRFNIINLIKSRSSYQLGLKPLCYEVAEKRFRRCGSHIFYYENKVSQNQYDSGVKKKKPQGNEKYYTLTWCYTAVSDKKVFFSHHFPYLHSQLTEYLDTKEYIDKARKEEDRFLYRSELCKTINRLSCEYLIVSNNITNLIKLTKPKTTEANEAKAAKDDQEKKIQSIRDQIKHKKVVVITARQHPGETASSWVQHGVMKFLLGDSETAKELRHKFIFFIVPMMNVDGCYLGTTRCNLAGLDFNRCWTKSTIKKTPVIHAFKKKIRQFLDSINKDLYFYLDLHAHSKKRSVFIYGLTGPSKAEKVRARIFPKILEKLFPYYFLYSNCNFSIKKNKRHTARISMFREFKTFYSYTCESTFLGSSFSDLHFSYFDYIKVGESLVKGFSEFAKENGEIKKKVEQELNDLIIEPKKSMKKIIVSSIIGITIGATAAFLVKKGVKMVIEKLKEKE